MELSPKLYRYIVRPKWFSNIFYDRMLLNNFDFKGRAVLDFGCGIGSSSFLFEPETYLGVDCDSRRIEYAGKLHTEHRFMTIKEGKLPVEDNSVDYVVILSVLHHIPDETAGQCLKEFERVLKEDGSVIIVEPCLFGEAPLANWYMSSFDKGKYIRDEEGYLGIFKEAQYETKVIKRYNQLLLYNKIMFTATPAN